MVVEGSSLPSIRPQAKLAERGLESLWGPVPKLAPDWSPCPIRCPRVVRSPPDRGLASSGLD